MASETELVNHALRKVGAQRILAITDDIPSAGIAQDIFGQERDDLLQSHPWNFAVTRKKLSRLADAPVFEYQHAFTRPADCLRIISVSANDAGAGSVEYKSESLPQGGGHIAVIMSNVDELWMRYVRRVTDVNLMTPAFRQVLILKLARVFATANANSNTLYDLIDREYTTALRQARSTDGIEDWPERLPEGSWAANRRGSWGGGRWPW